MASHKVLMLGAGFVTRPTLDILSEAGIPVTVACRTLESAKSLSAGVKNATPISLDVTNDQALDAEVAKHDLVISLIPYTFHATVIKSAIRQKKHVVTTSYVSPAMMELDQQCKDAGITVMNEIGLDPGLDHLYAVKTIDEVHKEGGKILSFLSYCGGLPAPEASDNPLGYKFSWSPRGVLLALRNAAKYWKDGKVVEVAGPELMATAKPYFIYPGYAFVAYPNRDSTPYKERYNIPEAETIIRGTLRYQGFPEFIKTLVDIGFLEDSERDILKQAVSWKEATQAILGVSTSSQADLEASLLSKASFASDEEKQRILGGLRWIGIFSDEKIIPRGNPLDTLCATLEKKMQFEENERDLVMLQHRFEIENKDGSRETRTSTLCEYGEPKGYSAMAKTVGVPCAVAVQQVLNGTLSEKGVLAPMTPQINDPLMKELKEKYGIYLVEKTISTFTLLSFSVEDNASRTFRTETDQRRQAVSRVAMWVQRGSCPHMVESTGLLMAAVLDDLLVHEARGASGQSSGGGGLGAGSTSAVRLAYSAAFSRFVTGLLDSHQDKQMKQSMYSIAKTIGLPATFVELRHQCTHEQLPSLLKLRSAAQKSLIWIWDYYWRHLSDDDGFDSERAVSGGGLSSSSNTAEGNVKGGTSCIEVLSAYLLADDDAVKQGLEKRLHQWDESTLLRTLDEMSESAEDPRLLLRSLQFSQEILDGKLAKLSSAKGNDNGQQDGEPTQEEDLMETSSELQRPQAVPQI
ncbi:Saccharopine dehydrogenase [NADP(+), L-glutamate-forming] [Neopestalotiopsis sp. 37M]|nr:Saccharopine dehydrogenase [NADP(+), L-glutamate-forming] [Neopestalotiopsis sp. 37M]